MRFMKGRGDLYTAVAENVQMSLATDNSEYCELEEIFFLSQRLLLQTMLNKWGTTVDDLKRATESDRLRAVGLIFLEQIREWIPYLLASKDPSGRLELDAWNGKRKSAQRLHHSLFIDPDVNV